MPDLIYYCKQEDNTCNKKEECKRYMECTADKPQATLYKVSCTERNSYLLYMKHTLILQEENNNGQDSDS